SRTMSIRIDGDLRQIFFPPQRQIQEIPRLRSAVMVKEAIHGAGVEIVRNLAELSDFPPRSVAETLEKPFVDGHAEALLWPVDHLVRDQSPDSALENMLEIAFSRFDGGRDAQRQLDKLVVQKRHASLERDSHAHLVHTHKQ